MNSCTMRQLCWRNRFAGHTIPRCSPTAPAPTSARQHTRQGRDTLLEAQPGRRLLQYDDDEDSDDEEERGEDELERPGRNNIGRLAAEIAKDGYDLEAEWSSISGSIISTTTGAAKVYSPTLGSGERPMPLLKPPSNPQVERLRQEEYEHKQRRRLFAREEEDYEGDYLGTSSYASSSSDDDTDGVAVPVWPPAGMPQQQSITSRPQRPGSRAGTTPQVSAADQEIDRFQAALRQAWQQSSTPGASASPPKLQRPGSASSASTGKRSGTAPAGPRSNDLGIPMLGVPSKTQDRLAPRLPPASASASSVMLTVAAGLVGDKRLEDEHTAFEQQMAALMKQKGIGAQSSGAQRPARPTTQPTLGNPATQQSQPTAGSMAPQRRQPPHAIQAASMALDATPLPFPKELKSALGGQGANSMRRPVHNGDNTAPGLVEQLPAESSGATGNMQAKSLQRKQQEEGQGDLQALRSAVNASQAKPMIQRPPSRPDSVGPRPAAGQSSSPVQAPSTKQQVPVGQKQRTESVDQPLFPASVRNALQGKGTAPELQPQRPKGTAQAPGLNQRPALAPGSAPAAPPRPQPPRGSKQQQQQQQQRPSPPPSRRNQRPQ